MIQYHLMTTYDSSDMTSYNGQLLMGEGNPMDYMEAFCQTPEFKEEAERLWASYQETVQKMDREWPERGWLNNMADKPTILFRWRGKRFIEWLLATGKFQAVEYQEHSYSDE